MRPDIRPRIRNNTDALFQEYEHYKRTYKNTDQECRNRGLEFRPIVFESHAGGWSAITRESIAKVAKHVAATSGEDESSASLRIAQRISATLQRESARAVLLRLPASAPTTSNADGSFPDLFYIPT